MSEFENRAVISGAAQSQIGRKLNRSDLDLTLEACRAAIADAGLTVDDIDGLASYPGAMAQPAGFAGPGTPDVHDAMRLKLNWHSGGREGAAQIQAVINAVMAVGAGLARHVLVYRTVSESTAQGGGRRGGIGLPSGEGGGGAPKMGGEMQWTIPMRAYSAACWLAMCAQRHMYEFGTTQEQLAQISLNARRQRGTQPQRNLPRHPHTRRLHELAHDHDAVSSVRLRRPVRRVHGGHRQRG